MTTTDDTPELPTRPQGDANLITDLTVQELRIANTKLGADVVDAVTTPTAGRWDALALIGWLWHKRNVDPRAQLAPWQACTAGQLGELLGNVDGDDQVDGDQADADDVEEAIAADPTVPAP